MPLQSLPIDALLPELLASLAHTPNLVLEAAPGAGKTTRVPPALLPLVAGEVLVLEPRRIAARLAARRVAAELGEQPGETVGYQVRFEDVSGPRTRLRFVTEGILTRRLLSDPTLRHVDAVILDEFHERHLDTDLALALLKRLQRKRPELRLIVMSATLDSGPIAHFLTAPVFRSEGRVFPLTVRYQPYSDLPLHWQVATAAALLQTEGQTGDTLAFLPGTAEIHRAARECEPLARRHGLLVLPLYGTLAAAEQDRALAPAGPQPRLILATNVAESSVTVPGVTAVIDSGLARVAAWSPWSGLQTLDVARISKAAATQRAGRAARTAPGRVLRLYPQLDYDQRAEHETPEILRADLTQLALTLRVLSLSAAELDWLDPPPAAALARAEDLLTSLDREGKLAAAMARLPLSPRLSRVLLAALDAGLGPSGCRAVALLGSGSPVAGDLLEALDQQAALPPDPRTLETTRQLERLTRPPRETAYTDDALLQALLRGFPDRVARIRAGREVLLANGFTAELAGDPPSYPLLLALDAEDRSDKPLPLIRAWCRVEPDWLLDHFAERLSERTALEWNRTAERVESVASLLYDHLILEQTRSAQPDPEGAASLLIEKALETGLHRFLDVAALANLEARFAFAGLEPPPVIAAFTALAQGCTTFAELTTAAVALLPGLERAAPLLEKLAPATLRLAAGRNVRVHYEPGKPPWIASRLQDFFGMTATPRLGPQQEPVTVHLLAPNQRALQTTTDLAGFWLRLYPQVRRELMRRYPRHQWPEKP